MPITRKKKIGTTLGGGLGGVGTGAAIGSIVPGIGTAIGAGVGGLAGLLGSYLGSDETNQAAMKQQKQQQALQAKQNPKGSAGFIPSQQPSSFLGGQKAGLETYNMYTPEQQQAFNQVLAQALSGLGKNQFDFAPIENQARKNFNEVTIPGIAERFAGMNALKSSAFNQSLGQAGAGLESELAAMKQNYNLTQQQALQNLLGIGLKPQFESLYRPGQAGFGESLLSSLATPGNIAGGLSAAVEALKDWRNKGQGQQQQNQFQQGQQSFAPQGQNPMSNLGSFNGIYNPGNMVPGMQIPSAPYAPKMNAQGGVSNVGALKALYGL